MGIACIHQARGNITAFIAPNSYKGKSRKYLPENFTLKIPYKKINIFKIFSKKSTFFYPKKSLQNVKNIKKYHIKYFLDFPLYEFGAINAVMFPRA